MGVDAKGLLTNNPTPLEIMDYLNSLNHVGVVNITPSSIGRFVFINFDWHGESRNMACFYDGECICDYETIWPHKSALVSISMWGMSDAIVMCLVKKFGGFYQLNDCADEWAKHC